MAKAASSKCGTGGKASCFSISGGTRNQSPVADSSRGVRRRGLRAHHRSSCLVHKMRRCGRGQSRVQREAKCRAAGSKPRTGSQVWLLPLPRAGALPKGPATLPLQSLQSKRSFSRHHFPGQLGGGRWQREVPANCVHAHVRARCSAETTRRLCDKV